LTQKKLTDTQRVVLCNAAMQLDGAVLPLPRSIRLNSGAMNVVLKSLLAYGLVFEQRASRQESQWREDESGQRFKLTISDEGCAAIGVEPIGTGPSKEPPVDSIRATSRPTEDAVASSENPAMKAPAVRAGTKLGALVEALSKLDGATIPELMAVTGWQAHSIRGAMSGALKKKMGLKIISEKVEGRGRVYRLTAGSEQNADPQQAVQPGKHEHISSERFSASQNGGEPVETPSTGAGA
jgi:hypothetical protein